MSDNAVFQLPTEMNVAKKISVYNSENDANEQVRYTFTLSILDMKGNAMPIEEGLVVIGVGEFSVKISNLVINTGDDELKKRLGIAGKVVTEVSYDDKGNLINGNKWLPGTLMLNIDEPTIMTENPGDTNKFKVISSTQAKAEGSVVGKTTGVICFAVWLMLAPPPPKEIAPPPPKEIFSNNGGGATRSIGGGVTRSIGGGATRSIGGGTSNYTNNTESGFVTTGSLVTKVFEKAAYKPINDTRNNRVFKLLVVKPDENLFDKAFEAFYPVEDKGYNPVEVEVPDVKLAD